MAEDSICRFLNINSSHLSAPMPTMNNGGSTQLCQHSELLIHNHRLALVRTVGCGHICLLELNRDVCALAHTHAGSVFAKTFDTSAHTFPLSDGKQNYKASSRFFLRNLTSYRVADLHFGRQQTQLMWNKHGWYCRVTIVSHHTFRSND